MTGEITQTQKRQQIVDLENLMLSIDGCEVGDNNTCPLKHSFADGIYVREIFIPKDSIVVGKIHKHEHPNFLMSGTVKIVTEFEDELLTGPLSIISKAGTKRA